jgi:hypothetical protein
MKKAKKIAKKVAKGVATSSVASARGFVGQAIRDTRAAAAARKKKRAAARKRGPRPGSPSAIANDLKGL